MENKRKKRSGLTFKLILGVALIVLCTTAGCIYIGVRTYKDSITRRYNDMAYEIAETAASYFTMQELKDWADLTTRYNYGEADKAELDAVMAGDRYQEILSLIDKLRAGMQANDIYVCVFDPDVLANFSQEAFDKREWNPIYYITDSYQIEDERLFMGDKSPIKPELAADILQSYHTGVHADNYYISNGQYGYNTSAVYPVTDGGQTVAFVGVEIPMRTLQSDVNSFISRVIQIALVITLILLVVAILTILKTIISPIRLVSTEAERFVRDRAEISEKLSSVKTRDEIQSLSESVLEMEIGIKEYIENLTRVTAEKERIGAELGVATQIQADMLPRIFPPFPDRNEFDLYATMTPAKEVGGDFYDFFLVDDDHLCLVMADVSGKGVPAALFMVIAKTLIKNRAQMGGTPSEILSFTNDQLCEGNDAELFVTVWLGILTISTGKGIAANAGHEHPVIRRADGSYELVIYRHSPAVATMEGIRFREHEFEMNPGDSLFVYTDGVPEATNKDNELYGTDRMLEALNADPDAAPAQILKSVKESIDIFVGEAPQFDDITMLGMSYFGKEGKKDA